MTEEPARQALATALAADPTGPDAVAAARNKLARFGDEITAWEALSSGTNYSN